MIFSESFREEKNSKRDLSNMIPDKKLCPLLSKVTLLFELQDVECPVVSHKIFHTVKEKIRKKLSIS